MSPSVCLRASWAVRVKEGTLETRGTQPTINQLSFELKRKIKAFAASTSAACAASAFLLLLVLVLVVVLLFYARMTAPF